MEKRRQIFCFFIFLFSPWFVWSVDQVVLKEGKTMSGTITDETENEVEILLGAQMYLRVDKANIKKIIRGPKTGSTRPVVTLTPTVRKPDMSPSTAPAVFNFTDRSQTVNSDKDDVHLTETIQIKTVPVKGPEELRNQPCRVTSVVSWQGTPAPADGVTKWKSIIIVATHTATLPRWNPDKNPDPSQVQVWEREIRGIEKHHQGHIDIYSEAMPGLGTGLMSLQAAKEADLKARSKLFYQTWRSRMEKRQQGFERRRSAEKIKTLPQR